MRNCLVTFVVICQMIAIVGAGCAMQQVDLPVAEAPIATSASQPIEIATPTPRPSDTVAALPSASPTRHVTPTTSNPTIAPTASFTAAPTETATPLPTSMPTKPYVLVLKALNIRGGPGTNYPVVASGKAGDKFDACGRNKTADWVQLCGYGTPQRWVYAGADLKLVEVIGLQVELLEIADPIPTPPLPTKTPDPCFGATSKGARERFTFDQIVPCLDTPQRVVAFMSANLRYAAANYDVRRWGINTYASARDVYAAGEDDCDGLAEFGACLLSLHGYEAYNVGISINRPLGHNVTGYVGRDGKKYSINNGVAIDGPFDDWIQLAQYYIDHGYAEPNQVIWLFDPCLSKTYIGDEVYQIPYRVIR